MISVALVGLGEIGLGAHLPALLRHPEIEIAALIDPDPDRVAMARALATNERRHARAEATNEWDVDAVVVATPPWVTPGLVVERLRAGQFVLAEKPVATSVAAAAAYDVLTPAERARLQIGLTYRHDPAMQALGEWIRGGRLGDELLVRAHIYDERLDPRDVEHLHRISATLEHGMPVVHEGAHVFDWLTFLLCSRPDRVADAWAVRTSAEFAAPNLCGARLEYSGGHRALVEFGWLTPDLPRCELTVLGSKGYAVLDCDTFELKLTTAAGSEVVTFPGERMTRCFDLQTARFADLVAGRRTAPDPSLADGLGALATAEQTAELARTGVRR
jgi:myo-inositol 2-dehydrogenase / D-chiro-inositol 1-dehydrogenase